MHAMHASSSFQIINGYDKAAEQYFLMLGRAICRTDERTIGTDLVNAVLFTIGHLRLVLGFMELMASVQYSTNVQALGVHT